MNRYIGKKLEGRYEILELIGYGGMAIVFKARDILKNKNVAVKILKDEFLSSDDFKRRFRNESKAIAVLSHPNIVKIIDVNFSENVQYIVMEYIDGITLKEYIEQQKIVKWKEAVHFTVQILRALQHAHDNGIVHRDIKPQNVMLLQDGTIKVMDFGIARFARENGRTMSDKAIGSVHYISPEQAKGDNIDAKTDLYAVGVIMYEMLTGKLPFDGDTPVSIAIKQMQVEPKLPSAVNPDIPMGLEEIIIRAMQKDRALRYQSAAEMLKDIDEFKHNPSVVFEYRYYNEDGTTKYFDKIATNTVVKEPKKRSYVLSILAGVTATCILVALFFLYIFFQSLDNKPAEITLIDLKGLTIEQAQQKLPNVKIVKDQVEEASDLEAGLIVSQKPEKDTVVKVDTDVVVVVSSGLVSIRMPDLVNETASLAKDRLERMGLKVEQVEKTDDTITQGHIIRTDPSADTELKKGTTVVIYVSLGETQLPIVVPTLTGLTESEARIKLLPSLNLGEIKWVDSNEAKGIIVSQDPLPNSKIEKGSKINIEMSNGTKTAQVVPITIPFPSNSMNGAFSFDVYVNDILVQSKTLNPLSTKKLSLSFELKDGKIMIPGATDGVVQRDGGDVVSINVSGTVFAIYKLNFASGTAVVTQKPENWLLVESGKEPTFGDGV